MKYDVPDPHARQLTAAEQRAMVEQLTRKLKPCPFCGKEARGRTRDWNEPAHDTFNLPWRRRDFTVRCSNDDCKASMSVEWNSDHGGDVRLTGGVIDRWNRRPRAGTGKSRRGTAAERALRPTGETVSPGGGEK